MKFPILRVDSSMLYGDKCSPIGDPLVHVYIYRGRYPAPVDSLDKNGNIVNNSYRGNFRTVREAISVVKSKYKVSRVSNPEIGYEDRHGCLHFNITPK